MDLFEKIWNLIAGFTTPKTKPKVVTPKAEAPVPPRTPTAPVEPSKPVRVKIPRAPDRLEQVSNIPVKAPVVFSANRPRPRGERTIVIVGFDFGTHSTKILYRQRNHEVARVLPLCRPVEGYPAFACPSLVRLGNGCLWFGADALAHSEGTLYRSLKVRLLGPAAEPDDAYPAGPCPDVLVAAYLAWAFKSVRNELDQKFSNADVRLNLAAPMDHLEDPRLKTRFLQIVQVAWDIAFNNSPIAIDQGVRLVSIEQELLRLLAREVVDASERKFDVLAETVAPIVSLSMDPRMAPGMYLIVDIGAGTTEISINHTNEQGLDNQVLCYFDQTVVIGGDRFERLKDLKATERDIQCEALVAEIVKTCSRVWGMGHRKDAPNHAARKRWRNLVILLAGGGTRHPAVNAAFHEASRLLDHFKLYEVAHQITSHVPANVDLGPFKSSKGDLPLLAVAQGLTRERETWPIVFEPAMVERLTPTAHIDKADSYWYVEGK